MSANSLDSGDRFCFHVFQPLSNNWEKGTVGTGSSSTLNHFSWWFFYKLNFSGYDEYEDEYAHIITENSPKGLVEQVVEDFQPVQLPELLVITGRACTRILSGYQKTKKEEETILASLREEGLLAKPGGKGQGGISFEIVDIASAGEDLSVGVPPPQGVIPDRKLRYFVSYS